MAEQNEEGQARVVRPDEIREALEQAIFDARGIVALEVRRPGQRAVRARLSQMVWSALWDCLHLDPDDDEPDELWPEGRALPAAPEVPQGHEDAALLKQRTARIWSEVQAELVRARARFPALHSSHEGLAVLLEEVREVEDEVFGTRAKYLAMPTSLRAELVQVAAMALRMVEDLAL